MGEEGGGAVGRAMCIPVVPLVRPAGLISYQVCYTVVITKVHAEYCAAATKAL